MKHPTKVTWTPADDERLINFVKSGASATRAAAALKRTISSVKSRARKFGCPFPHEILLRRARYKATGIDPINRV